MNADGSGKTNLTMSGADEMTPTWSPDGKSILYGALGLPPNPVGLGTMNPDGSNRRVISSHHAWRATMAPDGTSLLVEGVLVPAADELYLLNPDGSGDPVTIGELWDGLGDWQTVPGTQQPVDPLPRLPALNTACDAVGAESATPAPTPGSFPPIGGPPAPESPSSPLTAAGLAATFVGAAVVALSRARRRIQS
jgi:hypothetical protein